MIKSGHRYIAHSVPYIQDSLLTLEHFSKILFCLGQLIRYKISESDYLKVS